jgi:hypothetical protein
LLAIRYSFKIVFMIVMTGRRFPGSHGNGPFHRLHLHRYCASLLVFGVIALFGSGCSEKQYVAARPQLRPSYPSNSYSNESKGISPAIVITEISATRPPRGAGTSTGEIQQIVLESLQKRITGARVSISSPAANSEDASELLNRRQLALSGVQVIVRGSTEQTFFPGTSSVILEAVNTESGAVLAAAAGRSESLQHAASEAAERLASEMLNRNLITTPSSR